MTGAVAVGAQICAVAEAETACAEACGCAANQPTTQGCPPRANGPLRRFNLTEHHYAGLSLVCLYGYIAVLLFQSPATSQPCSSISRPTALIYHTGSAIHANITLFFGAHNPQPGPALLPHINTSTQLCQSARFTRRGFSPHQVQRPMYRYGAGPPPTHSYTATARRRTEE